MRHRIGDQGYRVIIGMDDLSVPWDPGTISIYMSAVPVRDKVGDVNTEVGATPCSDTPLLGDKQYFAGAVV